MGQNHKGNKLKLHNAGFIKTPQEIKKDIIIDEPVENKKYL